MKKSLAHLLELKQDEVELIAFKIRALFEDVQMAILFGYYTRRACPDEIGNRHYKITKEQLEQLPPALKNCMR